MRLPDREAQMDIDPFVGVLIGLAATVMTAVAGLWFVGKAKG